MPLSEWTAAPLVDGQVGLLLLDAADGSLLAATGEAGPQAAAIAADVFGLFLDARRLLLKASAAARSDPESVERITVSLGRFDVVLSGNRQVVAAVFKASAAQ